MYIKTLRKEKLKLKKKKKNPLLKKFDISFSARNTYDFIFTVKVNPTLFRQSKMSKDPKRG